MFESLKKAICPDWVVTKFKANDTLVNSNSLNIEALWDRMRELEKERENHDGTFTCVGCQTAIEKEVQRHIDDMDIDDLCGGRDGFITAVKCALREALR